MKRYIQISENINQIKTPEFKKWFGKSKVVDRSGKPLVVYHGSNSDFLKFKGDTYFTDDYMNADGYASGNYIYEVYLSIKSPLIIDAKDKKWDDLDNDYGTSTRDIVGNINRKNYDGVIFINIKDSWIDDVDYQDSGTVYVTFKSNQIKSAVGNNGNFNSRSNNILEKKETNNV